ncbi:MAG: hypothetical protein M3Y57_13200 [Acidobacteriota bacterium]|nr:hypothetical protein [Acidobacteriota bacterium]
MTALQQLDAYLKDLERRLRILAASKGAAVSAACALVLTVVLVWIANRYKFDGGLVLPFRVLLMAAVACAITFALALPVIRLNRRRVTRLAESRITDFHERLLTVTERPDAANPFTELVAEDALRVARENSTGQLIPARTLYASLAVAATAVAVLIWMISSAPGYWGYGASLLWMGPGHAGSAPLYDIAVQPGNKTVRRKTDQIVSAELMGFSARNVILHAKYHGALKWEAIPMQAQSSGNGYQFLFAGLSDSMEYWVQAGGTRSKHYTLGVKDLPAVKRVRVKLHFPVGIGLKDAVEDPGGDIRAVEGSKAEVSVLTDKPLEHGVLVLENGSKLELAAAGDNWLKATLPISKDGSYHVAALDNGDAVRITDDYFIEAKKDEPPSVRIVQPGRDPHVSPIEEVPVKVEAADDFGLHGLELHYAVNGGPEHTMPLTNRKDAKEAEGKATFSFEDFKLAPGDLVSFYATARDATHTSRSDIVMAQADAFDYKFRQSQQAGGGGGASGADQGNNISERQKEIIAATWNEMKDPKKERAAVAENARFLSGLQGKLGDQAKALAERMGNRELAGTNPEFEQFSKSMLQASSDMGAAVDQLKPAKWNDALGPEEKALQSLLRAESIFRDIQVSFGQKGGGGMGAGGEERDLARLFDLELDTSKNQYETGQTPAASGNDQQKQIDEALQRLKDLARRQQELAAQQHSPQQQFQQRWEEEQLRREAEQLRQQMQQLAQNSQSQAGQQPEASKHAEQEGGQQSSSSSGSSSGKSSRARNGKQSQQNTEAMRQAADALRRSEDAMRQAVDRQDASAQQRAASQLAEAQNLLKDRVQQQSGNSVSDLAEKARQLASSQKDMADRIKDLYGAKGINTARSSDAANGQGQGSPEMPEMNGPDYAGGRYRRRFMQESGRPATNQEKTLAAENDKLAQQMRQLQQDIERQAQGMAGEQPEGSRKLRKALSDAEQEELALRMQKNSDWMRQGFGSQTWPMEDSITAGAEQLSRQLNEAQQALNNGKPGGTASGDDKMAQALAEVQSMQEQLARQSQQSGQNQSATGAGKPSIGGSADGQDALDQLSALRSQIGRGDRQLNSSLNDAIGRLRLVNSQAGLLNARINEDAATSLARLELELARRVGQQQAGSRTEAPETTPEKYREALAEYYRTLSR